MAIYHLSVKPISRSAGRSATGAAAYRAAEKVIDQRTGEVFDYTRKLGVGLTGIVTPTGSTWEPTRSELWNAAEMAERRKDACVAREHEVALPKELTDAQRYALVREYARDLADRHGCAVDFAIHHPHRDRDGGSNENWHAHILTTTRRIDGTGLGQKCDREKAGRSRKADLEVERQAWADRANAALEQAGQIERIDHRSLEAQGIERQPTTHRGPAVTAMQRRGVATDVGHQEQASTEILAGEIRAIEAELAQARAVATVSIHPKPAQPEQTPYERHQAWKKAKREAERAKAGSSSAQQAPAEASTPTLADRIAASLAAMVEWIGKNLGRPYKAAQPGNEYVGPILHTDELHAVQSTGRDATIHQLDQIERQLVVGESVTISYRKPGAATVLGEGPDRGLGLRR